MNIYWLIEFLPEFVIILFAVLGLVGLLATNLFSKLPFIRKYNLIIQVCCLILLVAGVYLYGAFGYKESTKSSVDDLRVKLAQAEAKSAKANTEVVEKIVTKNQIIRQKGDEIIRYIDREVVKYDEKCYPIPKEVITAHNLAATLDVDKKDDAGEKK